MRALPGESRRTPPGPKPPARKDAASEQRRRIYAVAAELFAKRGYAGTSTDLIVRRAKVGYGTFYKFFPDKEACLLALFDDAANQTLARMDAAFELDPEAPYEKRAAAAIAVFFDAIGREPAAARACLVEALTAGAALQARYEVAIKSFSDLLARGRGDVGEVPLPESLGESLAGGVVWIAYQRLVAGEASELPALLPDAIQFALSPYVGEERAAEVASETSVS